MNTILLLLVPVLVLADQACIQRNTKSGAICVCNSTYCDTVPALLPLTNQEYQWYTTSKANLGFTASNGTFTNPDATVADGTIKLVTNISSHKILGFGGAFTDATGINILRLSEDAQNLLLQSYFGQDGIQYSIGRVPIGGTDFSTRGYSYDDTEEADETLASFALQQDDLEYKIPFVQRANELRGAENLKLFGSAWSAPIWMKTTDKWNGVGGLQDQYYDVWAEYHLKFFEEYSKNNISFWGVTTQNEPQNGIKGFAVQNNGFTSEQMLRWIKTLGPALRNSSYSDLKIMAHDDQRSTLPTLASDILSDSEAIQYLDGVAVHWYTDTSSPASYLDLINSDDKELFILATEACSGFLHASGMEDAVDLGSWARAEDYVTDIIEDLEHDVIGWVDWNMALSETGGPNWIDNEVDSPIIVNGTADEFYKQPMFYVLGHFSKFIIPNSQRVSLEIGVDDVEAIAFFRPDGKWTIVVWNKAESAKTVNFDILGTNEIFTVEARSVNTLLYFRLV